MISHSPQGKTASHCGLQRDHVFHCSSALTCNDNSLDVFNRNLKDRGWKEHQQKSSARGRVKDLEDPRAEHDLQPVILLASSHLGL